MNNLNLLSDQKEVSSYNNIIRCRSALRRRRKDYLEFLHHCLRVVRTHCLAAPWARYSDQSEVPIRTIASHALG